MYKRLVVIFSTLLLHSAAAAQGTGITATAYGTVNVRGGPGVQYEIVGQLSADERVPVTGRDSQTSGWLQIVLENTAVGWVASFAVLLDGDAEDLPIIVVDSTPVDNENPATVTAYGLVNVRSGPGMDFDIVGQLDVDDTAAIVGRNNEENDWLYIETDDVTGWVAYFTVSINGNLTDLPILVVPGTGEGVALEDEVIQTRFNVRLRAEPNASSDILIIVPFESNVTPLARSADSTWIYVVYQDVYGWGTARLFNMTEQQIEELPPFNRSLMVTTTPTAEATSDPDAES
jgi:uncharacterized protein YgiM (DUF1202 family)